MKKILSFLLVISLVQTVAAAGDSWTKWGTPNGSNTGFLLRAAYVIGGTSPLPLPAEIRSIEAFSPYGGATIGADVYHMFSRRWGIQGGLHLFYEGFHTEATVKNYRMGITRDGNYMKGNFTGTDVTNTKMHGITVPLTCTFAISPRWNVSAGPFATLLFSDLKSFDGEVYDGYLRENDPTGQKVEMTADNPATYDFKDDMRHVYWGVQVLFDWKATRHLNAFAGLDWAMSSIFNSDFQTIDFDMYPIYAKFGLAWRLW